MSTSTPVERRRARARLALLSITTALCSGLAMPAAAQLSAPAPVRQSVDANGVDLFAGTMNVDAPGMSMGSGSQGLSYHQLNRGSGWTDNVTAALNQNGTVVTVSLGGTTDQFDASGTTYTATQGNGATLVLVDGSYVYTRADGTVVKFNPSQGSSAPYYASLGRVTEITQPSGTKMVYAYEGVTYCDGGVRTTNGLQCSSYRNAFRISSVTNSYGYRLNFDYKPFDNSESNGEVKFADLRTWSSPIGVTETNLERGGVSSSESFGSTNNAGVLSFQVSDPKGRVTTYRVGAGGNQVAGITRPGSNSEDVTVGYTNGRVSSVTTLAGTWNYVVSDASGTRTVTVTDPASQATTYTFDIASQRMTSLLDASQHALPVDKQKKSTWTYSDHGRLKVAASPEGNSVEYIYDDRGNIKQTSLHQKTGAGTDTINTYAEYPLTCSNALTCNQPTSTTDARGAKTEYTYDDVHGGVIRVTGPASKSGVRPQVRYGFTSYTDHFGDTIYRPTRSSACITGSGVAVNALKAARAACEGTSDEVVATADYGSLAANNLLLVSSTSGSGDPMLAAKMTATTSAIYDVAGNLVSLDGPLPGPDDTVNFTYNADRERVETIWPDPDGNGPLKNRAVKYDYTPHGLVAGTSVGTANPDGSGFVSLQEATTTYDTADRKVRDTVTAGGTTFGVTQYSYDPANRTMCAAVRMNAASWDSPNSTNACIATMAGANGPDRISKVQYDEAGRPKLTISALETADQANEASVTYSPNGRVATLTDAKGNVTTYEYDAFDRLKTTRYPTATGTPGTSSTTDYEQLTPDANGNIESRRLRDGQVIGYTYDALNHLTNKDLPGNEPDATYDYDLLGRITSAAQNGVTLTFGYDALGRMRTQGGPLGTVAADFDAAGRRTSLTWPDQFSVTYDYYPTGDMKTITEHAVNANPVLLATFGYDDLGNRTSLTRGNGTVTTYTPDPLSRLDTLTQNLAGTAKDLTATFTYNSAGQVSATTRSDSYAWTGAVNQTQAFDVNGLNQLTPAGTTSMRYDARGNLTTWNDKAYGYTSENLLTSGPNGTSLAYDPAMRLSTVTQGSGSTRFAYDGADLIGEYSATGTLQRRYVHGPGTDEPLVSYDGSGNRSYLHADERGSVVAVTDNGGNSIATNSYDEYGMPAASNVGRFGYTGQTWLPEVGLWYYKARMYAPSLGRFMQTDPIGYADGLNLYGYVGGDPVDFADPTGLQECSRYYHNEFEYFDHNNNNIYDAGDSKVPGSSSSVPITVCSGSGEKGLKPGGSGRGSPQQNDILNHDIGEDIVVVAKKVPKPVQKFISDWIVDYDCGFIDSSSCSWSDYASIAGYLVAGPVARFAWLGREIKIGKNFRLAPFGNRRGHPLGRWPHYHYRPSNPAPPGQGIGRHRPWE